MTQRDLLLERLQNLNPVLDPSRLYEEEEQSRRLALHVQQREEQAMTSTKLRPVERAAKATRRWNKPVMAGVAAAIALVVATISAIALTSGSNERDVATTVEVTMSQTCEAPVSRPGQGFFQTCEVTSTSDPRLSGTEESNYFLLFDGPWFFEGTSKLTNDEGSWDLTFRGKLVGGETIFEDFEVEIEAVGAGAYEGLKFSGTSQSTGNPNGGGSTSVFTGSISPIDP